MNNREEEEEEEEEEEWEDASLSVHDAIVQKFSEREADTRWSKMRVLIWTIIDTFHSGSDAILSGVILSFLANEVAYDKNFTSYFLSESLGLPVVAVERSLLWWLNSYGAIARVYEKVGTVPMTTFSSPAAAVASMTPFPAKRGRKRVPKTKKMKIQRPMPEGGYTESDLASAKGKSRKKKIKGARKSGEKQQQKQNCVIMDVVYRANFAMFLSVIHKKIHTMGQVSNQIQEKLYKSRLDDVCYTGIECMECKRTNCMLSPEDNTCIECGSKDVIEKISDLSGQTTSSYHLLSSYAYDHLKGVFDSVAEFVPYEPTSNN